MKNETKIIDLISDEDFEQFKQKNSLCIVYFTATWCGPCRQISPKFENLCETHTHIKFGKVDIDKAVELSSTEEISCIPTFKIFKNASLFQEVKGSDIKIITDAIVCLSV